MNRRFIDRNTQEVFGLAYKWQDISPKSSGDPPFESGETIPMRNLKNMEVQLVPVDELVEVTPTLVQILKFQAVRPDLYYNVKWADTLRPPDKRNDVLLSDINPYFKKKRERYEAQQMQVQREEFEKRARQEEDMNTVFTDLKGQTSDIVDMWLRMIGYDLNVMQRLANTSTHFANIMRNDYIWMNALETHYPYVSTHFMGPLKRTIHPWVMLMLDGITMDATKHGGRYPKRLMELRTRLSSPTTMKTEIRIPFSPLATGPRQNNPRVHNTAQTTWLSHIWQCGQNIYGLFSTNKRDAQLHIGKYLIHWDALTEHPFVSPGKKSNLLDFKTEKIRLVDSDQDGFIVFFEDTAQPGQVKDRLMYVEAGIRPGIDTKTTNFNSFWKSLWYATIRKNYWSDQDTLPIWLTPNMIVVDSHTIIPRIGENRLDINATITIDEPNMIDLVTGFNSGVVTTISENLEITPRFVSNILNPRGYTEGPFIADNKYQEISEKVFFLRPRLGMGIGGIMYHWHHENNRMQCFDYSQFKLGDSGVVYTLDNFTLTSKPIASQCYTCKGEPKFMEQHDSEKPFCSQECQKKHYEVK
jgi:hypothetical protein